MPVRAPVRPRGGGVRAATCRPVARRFAPIRVPQPRRVNHRPRRKSVVIATTTVRNRQDDVVLSVEGLEVEFPNGRAGTTRVVAGVSFDVSRGETLGIVGESGCGKSTTARAILQLTPPSAGSVRLAGQELTTLSHREMRLVRRKLQVVLQDPISALNPRRKVRDIVGEVCRSGMFRTRKPVCGLPWTRSDSMSIPSEIAGPASSRAGSVSGSASRARW
ncbi:ATP-binding cassette domain-containing protein [Nocardia rhamnosiphila]|uniref:ATP-binding cassette domain-containing protein n=1 Tax=Nocardia rhamnosiphila TaxID=426716 RepID=UPI0033C22DF7